MTQTAQILPDLALSVGGNGRPALAVKPVAGQQTGDGHTNKLGVSVDANALNELAANGVKFTASNVVATGRLASGQVVFLETGNSKAGLQHIVEAHATDFAKIGISQSKIPEVVMRAVQDGRVVGYQGVGVGRPIYQIDIDGVRQNIAVTVSSNGFIVGANPAGKVDPK
jgi:filamentous hemagglutinin